MASVVSRPYVCSGDAGSNEHHFPSIRVENAGPDGDTDHSPDLAPEGTAEADFTGGLTVGVMLVEQGNYKETEEERDTFLVESVNNRSTPHRYERRGGAQCDQLL